MECSLLNRLVGSGIVTSVPRGCLSADAFARAGHLGSACLCEWEYRCEATRFVSEECCCRAQDEDVEVYQEQRARFHLGWVVVGEGRQDR